MRKTAKLRVRHRRGGTPVRTWLFWAVPLAILVVVWGRGPTTGPPLDHRQAPWRTVERALDGDTIVLAGGERVRYIGMDTPELHHPKKPVQAYAREAWICNRELVEERRVRLEFDVQRQDRYGRTLAYVFLEDGTFVNAELIRQGYAQLLTIPPNVQYQDQFLALQRQARDARRGLWGRR